MAQMSPGTTPVTPNLASLIAAEATLARSADNLTSGTVAAARVGDLSATYALASLTFNVKNYGAKGDGVTDDTAAVTSAWTALKTAGGGTLLFPDGNYLTADLLFQSASKFRIEASRNAWLWSSKSTLASPGLACHDVLVIADCTDFAVVGLNVDGRRDTIQADQFLAVNAASGQRNVTVTNGADYVVGEVVSVWGGTTANGGTETNFNESNLTITAIAGNALTLSSNLTHSYTATGSAGGATVTRYQTGGVVPYSIAGRSLGNEDAQNGLHLISCTRFAVQRVTAQNTWESPIKLGTGFAPTAVTDGCSHGVVSDSRARHGYDQGISVWNCQYVTVVGNDCTDAGWAGISFSHSADCVATGNVCTANIYSPAFDRNEGAGIAVEGGVRVVVAANVCSGNNSNGIRLNISPMFGGAALSQGVSGSLAAGATAVTLSGTNTNFVAGSSFTIVDPANNMIRETIYVTAVNGTAVTVKPLRNAYASGPTIYARFGDDVLITGNTCAEQVLSAGIHADQQINLRVFSNDCSRNGFNGTAFTDTQGCYGIHLHSFCQEAVVEANTCSSNAQEGIVIDNDNRGAQVLTNACSRNGIKGTNQKMGIKLYGLVDGVVSGNECNYNTHSGIYTQTGSLVTAHLTLAGNTCLYNGVSGIWLDNGGSTVTVLDNKIAYNSDTGIKVLGYKNSIFKGNQCYNQQGQEGIRFDDNGTNYCTKNIIAENLLYDDQGSPSQSWGIRELGNTATSSVVYNRMFGNTNAGQLSLAASSTSTGNILN